MLRRATLPNNFPVRKAEIWHWCRYMVTSILRCWQPTWQQHSASMTPHKWWRLWMVAVWWSICFTARIFFPPFALLSHSGVLIGLYSICGLSKGGEIERGHKAVSGGTHRHTLSIRSLVQYMKPMVVIHNEKRAVIRRWNERERDS